MEKYPVKILSTTYLTHDVRQFKVEKPPGYTFIPGQATEISLDIPGWEKEKRPFTFTSLNEWDHLEFTIKIYREHKGFTAELEKFQQGDTIYIHDVWGAIQYKGSGHFIAGGAGITPFIAIIRQLVKDNKMGGHKLIFSNKTTRDIILKEEFEKAMGDNFINVITREHVMGYNEKRIDEDFLLDTIKDFGSWFYICGPDKFVSDMNKMLINLGAETESLIVEQ